jgi:trk system potassium uptake protein TrkA
LADRLFRTGATSASADKTIVVIGLGRFGSSVARALIELGHEVLGVDASDDLVQDHVDQLTHVVAADTTNVKVLAQLGISDFSHAVVGIGDVEASILTASELVTLGLPNIWAKATTAAHGRILERVGAHHVVYPEGDMGVRVAHLVTGRMLDYIELDDDFALVETTAPAEVVGKSLAEAGLRDRYGVTVVCIKPQGQPFTYATPDTVIGTDDVLLVAGETASAEGFADLE